MFFICEIVCIQATGGTTSRDAYAVWLRTFFDLNGGLQAKLHQEL